MYKVNVKNFSKKVRLMVDVKQEKAVCITLLEFDNGMARWTFLNEDKNKTVIFDDYCSL